MRVMITGGTGFVGYHTTRALMAAGHTVNQPYKNARAKASHHSSRFKTQNFPLLYRANAVTSILCWIRLPKGAP